MERFWRWLRWRLFGELRTWLEFEFRVVLAALEAENATGLTLERRLDGFHVRLAELNQEQQATQQTAGTALEVICELRKEIETLRAQVYGYKHDAERFPRLTLGAIRAWEAVCFASRKTEADFHLRKSGDPEADTMLWVEHYLREQGWEYPGIEAARDMIAIYERLRSEKRVPA